MKKHTHKWKRTGMILYQNPPVYQEKCKCGMFRGVESKEKISCVNFTKEEFKKWLKLHHPEFNNFI